MASLLQNTESVESPIEEASWTVEAWALLRRVGVEYVERHVERAAKAYFDCCRMRGMDTGPWLWVRHFAPTADGDRQYGTRSGRYLTLIGSDSHDHTK